MKGFLMEEHFRVRLPNVAEESVQNIAYKQQIWITK